MRRKNGFTLIELLAVILILGIIALIAIPTVNNIINESRSGAFRTTVQNLTSAAEQQCQLEQMKGDAITKLYVFDENGATPSLSNVKGSLPTSGSIALNNNCEIVASLSNGSITVTKNLITDDYKIVEGNTANDNLIVPLNKQTKKMLIAFLTGETLTEEDLAHYENLELRTFMAKSIGQGFVYYANESDEAIASFETLVFANEGEETSVEVMERIITLFESGNAEIFYYRTDDYVFLIEGVSDFSRVNTSMLPAGTSVEDYIASVNVNYEYLSSNDIPGMEKIEIVY